MAAMVREARRQNSVKDFSTIDLIKYVDAMMIEKPGESADDYDARYILLVAQLN